MAALAATAATWLGLYVPAHGQVAQVAVDPQRTVNVQLAPLGADNDVNSPQLFGGISPAVTPAGVIRADIGFDYIQPLFSNRSVSQVIPGATGPVGGGVHNFSNDFTFLPRLALQYDFADLGFGLAASAKLLEITGKLHRELTLTPGGTASVDANGLVDVAAANVIEATRQIDLGDTWCFGGSCLQDTLLLLTGGGRYAYVHQNYSSTLVAGGGQNVLTANQEFTGFGITGSVNTISQLFGNFVFYTNTRGSFLLGTNDRTSSIAIVAPSAQSSGVKATDNRTLVVPSLEWEAGIGYGLDLARTHDLAVPLTAPLLWFKTGFVGQLWGNVGLLKINDASSNQFTDSLLLLLGFTVQIGLDY
jgi:hypothetical protein